ncbi:hypothetical protein Nepgr_013104 [Nepenthes gracilis]|uniref:GATA transcription factor n=1 Tax=Nepenthes gracilis TaxID=150966 RepID=A0AAD3XNP3_NEPGR|nr:hypothetical protein Nepgr_013104 [Nepenthes gracilis]
MVGTNFMDETDCGSFFDHIDDLLEFSNDEFDSGLLSNVNVNGGACEALISSWCSNNNSSENFASSDSIFSANSSNITTTTMTASDLSAELSVPYEDIVQLEWLSNFVEDSFSFGGMTTEKGSSSLAQHDSNNHFQTSSPVSVLESSGSCSNAKTISLGHEKRARSKRSRPAAFNPRAAIQLISPTSSVTDNQPSMFGIPSAASSESVNYSESCLLKTVSKSLQAEHKKKKKIRTLHPSGTGEMDVIQNQKPNPPTQAVRKCTHCEITKTPQWRTGPMGPKTLCNACGVRHKSGRLFPEYRPAASPTFIPSLHSNSHRKVLEMRGKTLTGTTDVANTAAAPAPAPVTNPPELIPRNNLLPAYV